MKVIYDSMNNTTTVFGWPDNQLHGLDAAVNDFFEDYDPDMPTPRVMGWGFIRSLMKSECLTVKREGLIVTWEWNDPIPDEPFNTEEMLSVLVIAYRILDEEDNDYCG